MITLIKLEWSAEQVGGSASLVLTFRAGHDHVEEGATRQPETLLRSHCINISKPCLTPSLMLAIFQRVAGFYRRHLRHQPWTGLEVFDGDLRQARTMPQHRDRRPISPKLDQRYRILGAQREPPILRITAKWDRRKISPTATTPLLHGTRPRVVQNALTQIVGVEMEETTAFPGLETVIGLVGRELIAM